MGEKERDQNNKELWRNPLTTLDTSSREEVRRNARYMEQVIERKRREIARAHSESIDDDDEE